MDYRYRKTYPVEEYDFNGVGVLVARTDLVPEPPLPPYLKMVELLAFLRHIKDTENPSCIGYYATPESDWVRIIPPLCQTQGMGSVIGYARTKVPLPGFLADIPEGGLMLLKPNFYGVNYAICRRHVLSQGGFMIPMGVDHPVVVESLHRYFDRCPLPPKVDLFVVPTGSGVALSGIARHLDGRAKIVAVCTRPTRSVRHVVEKYVLPRIIRGIRFIPKEEAVPVQPPFPAHRFWECSAWGWLTANLSSFNGKRVCFVNLGS